ncbi:MULTISPECIES: DUF402 domain-containing protein [Actinokineospora]|uniref:DUF402 domain-containing protein n=1 Tax=Actinokineospora fastidiosa TaxID=1816 RepID=A0A918GFL8_9PSEU|nr:MULTISPECIES: DUF402 domain-containing protein [Actinokineospora]UVS80314.1 hypothetical protein Actkin_04064 [Actinokineospora sp. UTMC 2448]GGS34413.1 hypothetical protein GCM10010171_31050 [Actinokineospora fastidiosa]
MSAETSVPLARRDHTTHAPKVEVFDPAARTNVDPKGFVRLVDEYRHIGPGLYMARPVDGHRRIAYFESALLPAMGLRVSRWRGHPGVDLGHDFYIDVVDISVHGDPAKHTDIWQTVDLYLDVLVRTGRSVWVEDNDELLAAVRAGVLDLGAGERALSRAQRAVAGIAHAGYDVNRWLAGHEIVVPWHPL